MRTIAQWSLAGSMAGVLAIATVAVAQPMTDDAQSEQDVRQLLKNANDATRDVDAVSYHATRTGIGAMAARVPVVKGEMLLIKNLQSEGFPAKIHVDGKAWPEDSAKPVEFEAAYNGETAYKLDRQGKTLTTAAADKGGEDLLRGPGQALFMLEFAHPAPFDDEINAAEAELEGQTVVNGVTCNVVYIEYGDALGDAKARWYFGAEDNLPRKVERLVDVDGKFGAVVLTLSDLEVDPAHTSADLTITAPSGYETAAYEAPAAPERPELLAVGTEAPGWTLSDPEGNEHSLSDYRGKIVLMDFWAPWCGPCKAAMPSIQDLHERFKGRDVVVLGISTWEREGYDATDYMREHDYSYGLMLHGTPVAEAYRVPAIPTFYLIDKDGTIIQRDVGFAPGEEEKLAKLIEMHLDG